MSILEGPRREIKLYLLHHRFEILALECPKKTALIFEGGTEKAVPVTSTYENLNDVSNQIARIIILKSNINNSKPNNDGDYIVAVCLNPSDKLIKILLGIWKTRATYLPLSPNFPKSRIQYIMQDAKPILVICEDSMNTKIFKDTPVLKISELFNLVPLGDNSNVALHEVPPNFNNDIAIILYTSGSGGVSKGVRLPHFAIQNRLEWQWRTFPYLNVENHTISKTELTFVDSISEIWGPLLSGLTLVIASSEIRANPERLVDVLERYSIRRIVLVPCQLRVVLTTLFMHRGQRLSNLKMWICSGEALAANLVRSFYDYFPENKYILHNFYGSTELMGDVTYFTCKSKKHIEGCTKIPIGIPINNTVIYILNAELQPVHLGEVGEIFVSGLNVSVGYTNDRTSDTFLKNHLTENRIYSRIFRTGDYGRIQNGVLMYEGRSDSQIKIRGNRVNLLDIERSAVSLDFVEDAAVVCYQRGEVDQTPIAFIKLKSQESNLSGDHIRSILKEKLPDYMIPHTIVVNTIPFLQNGKIDRQQLVQSYAREKFLSGTVSHETTEFDLSGVPKALQKTASDFYLTIAKVLGMPTAKSMKLSSNFYDVGGNSLNSICTVSLLRDRGYNISIQDFISAGSVDEILNKMRKTSNLAFSEHELDDCLRQSMEVSPLQMAEKELVTELIAASFYEKGNLDQWLKPGLNKKDYKNLIESMWKSLVEKELSFSLKNKKGKIIGAALNYDEEDKPNRKLTGKLITIFTFLDHIEKPILDKLLPKGRNKVFHSFLMGTSNVLNSKENIVAMNYMEKETLKLAKRKKFTGVFTTNTHPLSVQLGTNVFKYKVLLEYQVNQYKLTDGTRPFEKAPNSQKAVVQWREVAK